MNTQEIKVQIQTLRKYLEDAENRLAVIREGYIPATGLDKKLTTLKNSLTGIRLSLEILEDVIKEQSSKGATD